MVYENVQIGNFLMVLGYAFRSLNRPLYGSFNLYQQTRFDPLLHDIFGMLNGRYFILEFKRTQADAKNELKKKKTRELLRVLGEKSGRTVLLAIKRQRSSC